MFPDLDHGGPAGGWYRSGSSGGHRWQNVSAVARQAQGLAALHIVSAWASEDGIALGQVATDEKSNEITAIPQLLEQIELADTLITIDAMGCQKEIAQQIVDGDGDFVIAVKDNQPKLREAIATFLKTAWSVIGRSLIPTLRDH